MKSKLEIYALAVCFAASVCLVISLSVGAYAAISIAFPDMTMSSSRYYDYQTNDAYWRETVRFKDSKEVEPRPAEEELTKRRLAAYEVAIKSEQRDGVRSLLGAGLYVIFGSVFLFVHWRIAKSARA